jgi:hypothetical protein
LKHEKNGLQKQSKNDANTPEDIEIAENAALEELSITSLAHVSSMSLHLQHTLKSVTKRKNCRQTFQSHGTRTNQVNVMYHRGA